MPKLEVPIVIQAPSELVYKVLADSSLSVKWNLTINSQEELPDDKFLVNTTIGDVISQTIEDVENKSITIKIEKSLFTKMGYILKSKRGHTEVIGWAEFENEKNRNVLEKAGGLLLDSLKRFVEFVHEGGDIDQYDKKAILVSM